MMDIKEIMSIIPHRPPFLLIDRVEEIVEGEKIVAIKNVTMNEPFFVGHYPGEPVMPVVLIVWINLKEKLRISGQSIRRSSEKKLFRGTA